MLVFREFPFIKLNFDKFGEIQVNGYIKTRDRTSVIEGPGLNQGSAYV